MVYLNLTAGTASNPIIFSPTINTNTSVKINGNSLLIESPGIYEFSGTVTLTSTASGSYGIAIVADGTQIAQYVNSASASGETTTIPLYYLARAVATSTSGYASVTFTPVGSPTIVSGGISAKRIG